jgi:hypothetical protein
VAAPVRLPLQGGCSCGKARFSLNGPPLLVYACHCHDCQKRSGSAFSLTAVVRTNDVAVSGPIEVARRSSRAGREIDHSACRACGGRVLSCAVVAPDYASLRVGTFDDARWAVPIAQTFVESAIPWAVIPSVAAVSWQDFDYAALGEAWRATAPSFERA